jgi:N4-(beta-N-acetylglucosaminyl)-L-asparaginase
MLNRRRFLTLSSLAGLVPPLPFSFAKPAIGPNMGDAPVPIPSFTGSLVNRPLVISTWNQPKANAAAQAALDEGGSALDAVEAGVKIPEADPDDMSVGYGGRPDRDGHVTLDACIQLQAYCQHRTARYHRDAGH